MKTKAVLIDRDGTIIVEPPGERLIDIEHAILEPAVLEAFKIFDELGMSIIIITNQAALSIWISFMSSIMQS